MSGFLVSPHSHPESPISGSTVSAMISKAVKLGRTHFAYTDMGTLTSALLAYKEATSKGLKFIPGLSIYFKDENCPITKHTKASKVRYYKTTLYAHNQAQFEALGVLASKARPTISSYGEEVQLWNWTDLEEAGKSGFSLVSSDVNDLLFKNALIGKTDIIQPLFQKLKSIFDDRISFAVVGSPYTKSYKSLVSIEFEDGTKELVLSSSRIKTNAAHKAKAIELVTDPYRHYLLAHASKGGICIQYNKRVTKSELVEGYLPLGYDLQLNANKLAIEMGKFFNVPVLYSDFAFYADKEDKIVQDVRLASEDYKDPTLKYMQSSEDATAYLLGMGLKQAEAEAILLENNRWASKFDGLKLKYDIRVPEVDGDKNPIEFAINMVKKVGRMPWDNPVYTQRLKKELDVLANNGTANLLPYFFPIAKIQEAELDHGVLVGPGRGSASGSLLNYLLGITHVDPIKHNLSFERFISLDRIAANDWPDIDGDRSDRTFLVGSNEKPGFLYTTWGKKAAQISTRTMLRLKSSIKDVNRFLNGSVEPEIEVFCKNLPSAPQGVSDQKFVFGYTDSDGNTHPGLIDTNEQLQKYASERPNEWSVVVRCLGISRNMSAHASAFLIADKDVESFAPMFPGSRITQYEAKGAAAAGGIKYDFLVVNNLLDIQKCLQLINKKNGVTHNTGYFDHKGAKTFVWDLPEDGDVYRSIWNGDTETCFQISTHSMIPFVKKILPQKLQDLSDILALVRPGPLDYVDPNTGRNMAEEYVERKFGRSSPDIFEMGALLPETFGVQVYQEQTSLVAREIGALDPVTAEKLRRAMGKKLKHEVDSFKPIFIRGAVEKVGAATAEKIWAQMETSSRYSFNKSHAISYAMITYACMFLKHYYPLEWWASILSNASEKEISTKLFRYVKDKISPPDINLSTDEMVIDYANNTIRSKLTVMRGIGDAAAAPILENRPYKDIKDFVAKKVAGPGLTKKLIHVGVMDSLFAVGSTLEQKLTELDLAYKQIEFETKVSLGKNPKPIKAPVADKDYLGLSPIQDALAKKSVLPTLPIDLTNLVVKHSKLVNEGTEFRPMYADSTGRPRPVVGSDKLEALIPMELDKYFDFCCIAYVVEAKEFDYAQKQKSALKMILDIDGLTSEFVQWPDYNSGKLEYPREMGKGDLALIFMKKRPNKPDASVVEIKIIESAKKGSK